MSLTVSPIEALPVDWLDVVKRKKVTGLSKWPEGDFILKRPPSLKVWVQSPGWHSELKDWALPQLQLGFISRPGTSMWHRFLI